MITITLHREMYRDRSVLVARHPYDKHIFTTLLKSGLGTYEQSIRGWILKENPDMIERIQHLFSNIANIDTRKTNSVSHPPVWKKPKRPKLPPLDPIIEDHVQEFEEWMRQMRYSENSIKSYAECIRTFFRFHKERTISSISNEDLIRFNKEYIIAFDFSTSYQNQIVNGLKLFYRSGNHGILRLEEIERPFNPQKLPVVLSLQEIESLFNATVNLKHKSMLMTIYSCGLRRGELLNLRINDIDSDRMLVHIKGGKGKKDRMVPLGNSMLTQLRVYVRAYHPMNYLFEGQDGGSYSAVSLQKVFHRAVEKAKIKKKVSLHTLRHSYATHLLESGVNLRYIQDVLGHRSPNTTQIYTHVSSQELNRLPNPLDKLNI